MPDGEGVGTSKPTGGCTGWLTEGGTGVERTKIKSKHTEWVRCRETPK